MRFLNKIYAICGLIVAVLLPSCGNEVTVDQMVQDARDSYADGDYASCERLCNDILENKQPELTENAIWQSGGAVHEAVGDRESRGEYRRGHKVLYRGYETFRPIR